MNKLRLTVDQLEMRLRNQGISKIEDLKTATLEPNGQLGYELKEDAKPLTVREFKQLMNEYFLPSQAQNTPSSNVTSQQATNNNSNIFQEINNRQQPSPKQLQ